MKLDRLRLFIVAFGVTLAALLFWFVKSQISFHFASRHVSIDTATIRYHTLSGEWGIDVYNGSDRKVRAVLVEVTVPITEVKRIFRLTAPGMLGSGSCPPYTALEFRGDLGGFLPDRRIHGLWRLKGVEF